MPPNIEPSALECKWIDALVDRFFNAAFEGRPVYLALDEDELDEIADLLETSSKDLVSEVRSNLDAVGNPFGTYMRRWNRWNEHREGAPTYLPLLAVCVLAASAMGRDESAHINANDYYTRLELLTGLDRKRAEDSFGELSFLWVSLGEWLGDDLAGKRGNPMISEPEWFTKVGWPISQCIFRATDRYRLPDCFLASDLRPGDALTREQLYRRVKRWAEADHHFTPRGTAMIRAATGNIEQQLIEIAFREFEQWDGALRDREGRRRGEIRLAMLSNRRKTTFLFRPERPEGFPETFTPQFPHGFVLKPDLQHYYERLPFEVDSKRLDGISLKMSNFALTFTRSSVIPFAENMDVEGWMSVSRVSSDRPHCVLIHDRIHDAARRYLASAVTAMSEPIRPKALPDGWNLYKDIWFKPGARTETPELRCLVPRSDSTSQLIGGLRLRGGSKIYMSGFEPRLVASSADHEIESVEVNGLRSMLDKGSLDLSTLRLDPGEHELVMNDITLTFSTARSLQEFSEPVQVSIAHRLNRQTGRPIESGSALVGSESVRQPDESWISGAYSEESSNPGVLPIFARMGGGHYFALGSRPGQISEFGDQPRPDWLRDIRIPKSKRPANWDGLEARDFISYVDFRAAWILRSCGERIEVQRIGDASADIQTDGDDDAVVRWSNIVLNHRDAVPQRFLEQWNTYVNVALELNKR